MKKLLLAAVACCAFATPSFADNNELPEHLWGKWCWDGSGKDIDADKKILDNFRQDDKCWPSKTLTLGRREVKYEMITCRVISAKTALEPKLTAQGSPVLMTKVYWECRTHDGSGNERPERYTAYLYASYVGGEISLTVAYENYWRNDLLPLCSFLRS
jgi:hypothetical protein